MDSVAECLSGVAGHVALAAGAWWSGEQPVAQGFATSAAAPARYVSRSVSKGSLAMVQVAAEQSGASASAERLVAPVRPVGLMAVAAAGQAGS